MTALRCILVASIAGAVGCGSDETASIGDAETSSSTSSSTSSDETSTNTSSSTTHTHESSSSTAAEPACAAAWQATPVVAATSWEAAAPSLSQAYRLAVGPGGDFVLPHASVEEQDDEDDDVITVAYGADGNTRWIDRYAGSGLSDYAYGVSVDTAGRSYVLVQENLAEVWGEGWTFIDARMVVLAYDEDGGHRWRWEYHPEPTDPEWPENGQLGALAIDSNGDVHVMVVRDYWTNPAILVLFELDPFGNVLAETTHDSVQTSIYNDFGVAADGARRILFEWQAFPQMGGVIHTLDDAGQLVELTTFGGREFARPRLAVAADGATVAVGYSRHDDGHFGYLRAFTGDGTPALSITREPLPTHPSAVAVDCDGTIFVTEERTDRARVLAFAPEGDVLWDVDVAPPSAGGTVDARAIAVAPDSSAVVAIGSAGSPDAPWFIVLTPG